MSLIKELQYWCMNQDEVYTGTKALKIYNKCLINNKKELAKKIESKYGKYFPQSDLAISLGMLLIAHKTTT